MDDELPYIPNDELNIELDEERKKLWDKMNEFENKFGDVFPTICFASCDENRMN